MLVTDKATTPQAEKKKKKKKKKKIDVSNDRV